jgi:AcrR family transcriptional regulator
MGETPEQAARRTAILEAAVGVFLRYGYKKTSMDDLARAAGLSRQGLYLHFATKDALFKEALLRLIALTREAGRAALAREDLAIDERLLAAFEAVHGHAIGQIGAEHLGELLETSAQLVGPVVDELDAAIIADLARALRASGVAARWKDAGLSARDLAEHLYAASCGIKHRVTTAADYRPPMRTAIRLVCRGGSWRDEA